MIRFSAEAIFASSTSQSGVRIPLIRHEDLRSSTDSNNSTSSIHSTASVGNCEQIQTSVFESYLPISKCCWSTEFVKVKFRNMQSLLVCPKILWKSSLLWVERIFGWRSRLKSWSQDCVWNLTFTTCNGSLRTCECKCVFRYVRNLRIESSWTRWRRRRSWICKNVSRYTLRIANIWRLTVPPETHSELIPRARKIEFESCK